jgi:hypothetical protein
VFSVMKELSYCVSCRLISDFKTPPGVKAAGAFD